MILVGTFAMSKYACMDNLNIYNYSSLKEGLYRLNLMPPMFDWSGCTEHDFDVWYANWLLTDPAAFYDLMRVMYDIYSGIDVYLCVSDVPELQWINESFMKFLQQRYGINCFIINEPEDFLYAKDYGSGFSIEGLGNFDIDKERMAEIAMMNTMNDKSNHAYDFIMGEDEDESSIYTVGKV